jgi:hypothetical protein
MPAYACAEALSETRQPIDAAAEPGLYKRGFVRYWSRMLRFATKRITTSKTAIGAVEARAL